MGARSTPRAALARFAHPRLTPLATLTMLTVVSALAACANVPEDAGFSGVEELVADRLPQRVEWRRDSEADRAAADAVAELLRQELTPDVAVQIALLNNAELQATF